MSIYLSIYQVNRLIDAGRWFPSSHYEETRIVLVVNRLISELVNKNVFISLLFSATIGIYDVSVLYI